MSCRNQDKKLIFLWRPICPFQCQNPRVSSLQNFCAMPCAVTGSSHTYFLQEFDTETAHASRGVREGREGRGRQGRGKGSWRIRIDGLRSQAAQHFMGVLAHHTPQDRVGCCLEFTGLSYIVRLHGIRIATIRSWFRVFVAGIIKLHLPPGMYCIV